ncbi:MAG: MBL fold metallo-hydrolase [Ruminococcaceae bacterium]|nr:MBL fold metallo-hydrolase [Oscillospiraceae bacterium]
MPKLYMLTEHSLFMMSFVFITDRDTAVVIDGGNPEDMPHLFEMIGERKIAAWILTHPHFDHISGFVQEIEHGKLAERIERIYYNFPSAEFVKSCEPEIEPCSILDFNRILPDIKEKCTIVQPGMLAEVDGLEIEFLFCGEERFRYPKPNLAVNESSIVFRVTADGMKSVLFLGDSGPEGGRALLHECGDRLKSDIVQMSHHGHSGVTEEVYQCIAPKICLWCAPEWLWEEEDIEFEPELWGTKHQRKWMDDMGVTHYVTKDGTQMIPILKEEKI